MGLSRRKVFLDRTRKAVSAALEEAEVARTTCIIGFATRQEIRELGEITDQLQVLKDELDRISN